MSTKASTTVEREYDSLIDMEIAIIAYFRKHGYTTEAQDAKERLQQWYRLQAEQEGKS